MVLALLLLGAWAMTVGAGRASAYTGESLVEAPGGGLTDAAKGIIENPTFIAENVGEEALEDGPLSAGEAASVFEVGGVLPVIAPLLALGAGYGVGTAICNTVFSLFGSESCFGVESEGTYEPPLEKGGWTFSVKGGLQSASGGAVAGPVPPMAYVWEDQSLHVTVNDWKTRSGSCKFDPVPLGDLDGWYPKSPGATSECVPGEVVENGAAVMSQMHGRRAVGVTKAGAAARGWTVSEEKAGGQDYCTEGLSRSCSSAAPPSNWPVRMSEALHDSAIDAGVRERVGQSIAHAISPAAVADPYSREATVPNCGGLTYAQCAAALESVGLEPVRNTLGWQDADATAGPDAVLGTAPAAGSNVVRPSAVTVRTNPGAGGMPVVIPAPGPDETYAEYVARLDLALAPHEVVLGEANENPAYGPEAVTGTSPAAGTRVDPAASTAIAVDVNPASAPPATGAPGSGWSPPSIPAISLAPLSGVHIGCNSFPFGVFCWYASALTSWGSEGQCPSFAIPVGHATHVDDEGEIGVDTCEWEPALNIVRPVIVLLGTLGIGLFFAYAAMGLGGPGGE